MKCTKDTLERSAEYGRILECQSRTLVRLQTVSQLRLIDTRNCQLPCTSLFYERRAIFMTMRSTRILIFDRKSWLPSRTTAPFDSCKGLSLHCSSSTMNGVNVG